MKLSDKNFILATKNIAKNIAKNIVRNIVRYMARNIVRTMGRNIVMSFTLVVGHEGCDRVAHWGKYVQPIRKRLALR